MIYRIRALIPSASVQAQTPEGLWVAAHPLPFYGGIFDRLRDAVAVFREQAYAVRPPHPGEFEMALQEQGWALSQMPSGDTEPRS